MIVIKEFPDMSFTDKQEMFKALRENKSALKSQKKMATKFSDAVFFSPLIGNDKNKANKANNVDVSQINKLDLSLVINTTKVMDSHSDVHLDGTWNKSVKEKKDLYLLQEHKMRFDSIITDEVKASVKSFTWKELGAPYQGNTQALVFDAGVSKERHPFMFEQYAKGYVKNHSVGMRYVKLELALDSEDKYDQEEKAVWDKHISEIANKEEAQAQGYFWAVYEAKIVEGSAVPVGSNTITPVLSTESKEAVNNTSNQIEPSNDTQFKLADALKNTKFNF